MRRADREITDMQDILAVLEKCDCLRLGLCAGNRPYIVPLHFAIATENGETALYFHCASEGRKIDMIRENPHACFEADCSYRLIKHEAAAHWSAAFESVMGEGTITILTDNTKKAHALDLLMQRHGFQGKPSYPEDALSSVCVLRLAVTEMTGKRNMPAQ